MFVLSNRFNQGFLCEHRGPPQKFDKNQVQVFPLGVTFPISWFMFLQMSNNPGRAATKIQKKTPIESSETIRVRTLLQTELVFSGKGNPILNSPFFWKFRSCDELS
jgi:hypothetical protein